MELDAFQGILLLEWELISKLSPQSPPLSNNFALGTTFVPSYLFLLGRRPPSVRNSLTVLGLGVAHNFVAGTPIRAFGLLQKFGGAGLILSLNNGSYLCPILAATVWQAVSTFLSKNPKRPFAVSSQTGQTRIDRAIVGEKHMLTPSYDPDGPIPTLMAAGTMWFGQFCARALLTSNESFITGLSLISLGYMCWYAFPYKYPFSQAFWTPSFSITTAGISILNYTAMEFAYSVLNRSYVGTYLLNYLATVGRHSLSLYFISTMVDRFLVTRSVEKRIGKLAAAVSKCALLVLSAFVVDKVRWRLW